MDWHLKRTSPTDSERLAREAGISPRLARLLALRGILDAEAATRFLAPKLAHLPPPDRMRDLEEAVERIRRAVRRQEKILVYGDYDVDGVTASGLLLSVLRGLGAQANCFVPNRFRDGYGVRTDRIEEAAERGYRLLITVDTGTRDFEPVQAARRRGLDTIVVDHHMPGESLPPAVAVLNPHRKECEYPEKNLTAVGVAFKLAQALLAGQQTDLKWEQFLSWVVIGTVADCAPLTGENRVIAHYGLKALRESGHDSRLDSRNLGLRQLLRVSDLEGKDFGVGEIAFRVAPRINAAGRMDTARDALDLLLTSDLRRAQELAQKLNRLNTQRQGTEEKILEEAVRQADEMGEAAGHGALVVAGEGWHRGVIGIVAQRLVERFGRPAFVISMEGDAGHGSGRTVAGFPLVTALDRMGSLFVKYGGHEQAAGLTILRENIGRFRERLNEEADKRAEDCRRASRSLPVDCELHLSEMDSKLWSELKRLEPCGIGNPKPTFSARELTLLAPPRILKERHLKIQVGQDGTTMEALGWRMAERAEELQPGSRVDLAFRVEENLFRNIRSLQLNIQDIRQDIRQDRAVPDRAVKEAVQQGFWRS